MQTIFKLAADQKPLEFHEIFLLTFAGRINGEIKIYNIDSYKA